MENEEVFNITGVLIVVNNFRTNVDHKSLLKRYGKNMSGRDKQLKICKLSTAKVKTGFARPLMNLI